MDAAKPRTVRLSQKQMEVAAMVARIDGTSVSEFIRDAVTAHIERRRSDPEFQARLRQRIAADQKLLDRMAAC